MMPGNHGNRQRSWNQGGNRDRNHGGSPNRGGNQHAREQISAIHAPYNFAPLHREIFTPDWAEQVSHDRPFRDGLCGALELSITAHTPILVGTERTDGGNNRPGEVRFHKAPDGRCMIPGSALRGMIRNVLEIAAFGRMRFVDDRVQSIRDLTPGAKHIYGDLFTETKKETIIRAGKKEKVRCFHPKSKAGWLELRAGKIRLIPCAFSRVEQEDLEQYAHCRLGGAGSSLGKYRAWTQSRRIRFSPGEAKPHQHSRGNWLWYSKAENLGSGRCEGTLVFTGQPMARVPGKSGRKHLEFIFHSESSEAIEVPDAVWNGFRQVHQDSDEWKYWRRKLNGGERVPVFYLEEDGRPVAMGLAMMFRLPYRHSIHDAVRHTSADHLANRGDDLPALIFGFTDEDQGYDSLKGRAWFTPAFAMSQSREREENPTILNGPKPSYYPNYIEQPQSEPGKLAGGQYKTLMDEDCRIRGFKRYPAQPKARVQPLLDSQRGNKKVQTKLYPLEKGACFGCRLVFHNLKPEELGALVWALTWGGNDALRHSVGMGKPFGFGQVSIRIEGADIRPNDPAGKAPSADECMARFVALMKAWKPDWEATPQIANLLAMADPSRAATAPGGQLAHMRLDPQNQFVAAKKKRLVLAAYDGGGSAVRRPEGPARQARQASASSAPPRGRVDIEAVKRKAAEKAARAGSEGGEVLPREYRVEPEQQAEIVEVRESTVIVRLADGRLVARGRQVQGLKSEEIRRGRKVFAYGKGLFARPVKAAAEAPRGPEGSGEKIDAEAMKRTLAGRFRVRDK